MRNLIIYIKRFCIYIFLLLFYLYDRCAGKNPGNDKKTPSTAS